MCKPPHAREISGLGVCLALDKLDGFLGLVRYDELGRWLLSCVVYNLDNKIVTPCFRGLSVFFYQVINNPDAIDSKDLCGSSCSYYDGYPEYGNSGCFAGEGRTPSRRGGRRSGRRESSYLSRDSQTSGQPGGFRTLSMDDLKNFAIKVVSRMT